MNKKTIIDMGLIAAIIVAFILFSFFNSIGVASATYVVSGKINLDVIYAGDVDNEFYFYVENYDTEPITVEISVDKEYFIENKQIEFPKDIKQPWLPIFEQYSEEWQEVHWMKITNPEVTIQPHELVKVPVIVNTNGVKTGTYFADIETKQISGSKEGTVIINIAYLTHVIGVVKPLVSADQQAIGNSSLEPATNIPSFEALFVVICILISGLILKRGKK